MLPREVPAWAKEILDTRAGKEHSVTGVVMQALAEILTPYHEATEELRGLCETWLRSTLEPDAIAVIEAVMEVIDGLED